MLAYWLLFLGIYCAPVSAETPRVVVERENLPLGAEVRYRFPLGWAVHGGFCEGPPFIYLARSLELRTYSFRRTDGGLEPAGDIAGTLYATAGGRIGVRYPERFSSKFEYVDLRLPARPVIRPVLGTETLSARALSDRGRFALFVEPSSERAILYDIDAREARKIPEVKLRDRDCWVSDDGQWLFVGDGRIYGRDGKARFTPDDAIGAKHPAARADGKRLAFVTGDSNRHRLRVVELPSFRTVSETPLPHGSLHSLHFIEGTDLLFLAGWEALYDLKTSVWEATSGKPLSMPELRQDAYLQSGNGRLVTTPHYGSSAVTVFEIAALLRRGAPKGGATETLATEIESADPRRAWQALARLKSAGVTRADVERALASRRAQSPPREIEVLLSEGALEKALASEEYRDRLAVSEAMMAYLKSVDAFTYRTILRPAIVSALQGRDAEARTSAAPLFRRGEALHGGDTPGVIAARLGYLE